MEHEIYGNYLNHPSIACGRNEASGVFRMQRVTFGPELNHALIADTLENLGNIFHSLEKLEEAESVYHGCLKMRREIYGHNMNYP